jgi:hypothetical protein
MVRGAAEIIERRAATIENAWRFAPRAQRFLT